MIWCHYIKTRLCFYVDGALKPEEYLQIKNHLKKCEHCNSLVEKYRNQFNSIKTVNNDFFNSFHEQLDKKLNERINLIENNQNKENPDATRKNLFANRDRLETFFYCNKQKIFMTSTAILSIVVVANMINLNNPNNTNKQNELQSSFYAHYDFPEIDYSEDAYIIEANWEQNNYINNPSYNEEFDDGIFYYRR